MNHKSKFSFESPFSWQDLIALIDFLNSPDGCPWDAAQTHHSLAPYFLEETYEALTRFSAVMQLIYARSWVMC